MSLVSLRTRNNPRVVQLVWLGSRIWLAIICVVVMKVKKISFATAINRWDAIHFNTIAQSGYTNSNIVAFFPGLPALLAAGWKLGVPLALSGVILALAGSALAAWALFRIGGTLPACLWLIAPTAVFTFVPYTESLFCAAAFWAWERARTGRWLSAALLAAIACTFRVSGLFLIGALGLLALTSSREWLTRKFAHCLWLILPSLVLVGYVVYLKALTGSGTAWFDVQQQGWSRGFTLPWVSLQHTLDAVNPARWVGRPEIPWVFGAEIVSMGCGLITTLVCLVLRRWGQAGWVGIQVFAFSTSWWFLSVNRAVLLWFPLFVLAGSAASWTPRNSYVRLLWRALVALAVAAEIFAMSVWAWVYFTGGWAS